MASRPLSLGWCLTLAALVAGVTGCNCGGDPIPPASVDLPDAALSKVEVSRSANVLANGRDAVTMSVTVVKADGAALAGRTVRLEVSGEGNTVSPASGQTNPDGVMTATLVSTGAGTKRVKASVETEDGPVVLSSQPTVEFVLVSAAKLAFLNTSLQATAGAAVTPAVEVELQDTEGNRIFGSTASVTVELATGPASAQLEGTATVSAVDGVASFPGLIIKKAGTGYSLRATSGTLTAATSPTFDVVPAAPAALKLTGPTSMPAGGTADFQVVIEDAFANVASNYTGTVHFTSTDAQAVLPADSTFTAADAGQKSFPGVALHTAGSQTVTATDTVTATLTDSVTVSVVSVGATQMMLTVPATPVTAGSPFSVQVTMRDSSGNLATGYIGTVRFTSTDPQAVLPANYTFTAADAGQKTFSGVELRTAGTQSLTATDTAAATLTASQDLTVNPGALASLSLSAPPAATAGSAFSVSVGARDAFGNLVTGYTGTVSFSSDDTGGTLPADYTFTAGDAGNHVFNVTLVTAGLQRLRITDGTRNDSADVIVNPSNATRLEFVVPSGSIPAGTGFSVTVTAYDVFNNVATGYTGTVQFTSSDGQAVLPADYTFGPADDGTASFPVELRTAGSQTLTLTHSVPGGTLSDSKTVTPASPAQLAFSVQPTGSNARTPLAAVSVTVRDAYGNDTTASSPTVELSLTGGNVAATLSGTLSRDPISGVATFSDLSIDQEGNGFQLVATGGALTQATSTAFSISDTLAPAAAVITATAVSTSSVRVSWTAVGDDGTQGTAASHDLRYAAAPITNSTEFDAATPVSIPPPQAAGSSESALVSGLDLSGDHYFALKVSDGAGNSSLSNSPRVVGDLCTGVVCTPPAAVCSADGRSTVGYTSACVVSGGVGMCQDTPATVLCASYETCSAGACVPTTAGSQVGNIIITEFSALGSEFIELRNTTTADIDVRGYTLRNVAGQEVDIRAPSDPNGTGSTPVVVPADGYLYGIPNPSGSIPGGVGFVYGAPGTPFALADTGDAVALYTAPPTGTLQDAVDFRAYNTDPNTPLTASDYVGFAGSSTQLDPGSMGVVGNDTATNWCVSFYGAGVRGVRITNTAGGANGSCKVAVINEIYIDAPSTDDGQAFIEIAGPGGSVIGGARITDVEGKGANAGALNAFGTYTLPAGARIPADGILLVADLTSSGQTLVPNFVAGVDLGRSNVDFENPASGDAAQLINAAGTELLDTLGYDTGGNPLDINVAVNGLAMYETATAFYRSANGDWSASLSRSPLSTDSDQNRNDFRTDPSPTPGLPNDLANLTVATLTPNDGPATHGANAVAVVGTDFAPTMRVQFGGNPSSPCVVSSPFTASCTAVSNIGNAVAQVNVSFTAPADVAAPGAVFLGNAFTYTGNENETGNTLEADYCNLQFPSDFSVPSGTMTPLIYGRIYEAGVTETEGAPAGILAEVGYGANGSNPRSNNSWRFFPATYNVQFGNDDEFMGSFIAPTTEAAYSYTFRFSQDNGMKWTYCDLNGAGSNLGQDFDATQLGVMTVTAP
ncbi:beta strand repeat-containing protein [Hyalangium sp.]|uniref:beta strand repeat-containing protein n=1 Tax=Hyalangium sp. TaxID=2028555 RepID=UPI002D2CB8EF|nr:Ig-like domain-containing protein [Hyalangium sp.]HYI01103.1 Ig-like domain-containing protein [Hyalangium sp.]